MAETPIRMPRLGESVTEGTVDRWLKQIGDFVRKDEPLVEVVTDKVNAEIPSPFEGRLVRIKVESGATVPVGAELAVLEVEGLAAEASFGPGAEAVEGESPPAAAPAVTGPPQRNGQEAAGSQRFSPAVRKLAEEHGIDPSRIQGSGLGGRVTREDVLAYVASLKQAPAPAAPAPAAPAPAAPAADIPYELVPLTAMRRAIAENMVRSVTTIPHAWDVREVDLTNLVAYREASKESFRARHGVNLTFLPFLIQVLTDALAENPYLNSTWSESGIMLRKAYNIGIAVSLPDGLIVPVIHNADQLGLVDLARRVEDLATRARNKRLTPDEVRGGTFTLNNTGALGSVLSGPIINPGQAGILATAAVRRRPVVVGDGIAIRHMMNLCLSFDHRIMDGHQSGQFMDYLQRRLETWTPAEIRL